MSNAAVPVKKLSAFSVFRNSDFTKLWTAQLIETIGTALTSLAASIYVFKITDSAMSVGLMLMATAAPSLFVGLFAGVFVDRYDRKRIMVIAELLRAILVFLIPLLAPINIIWLYVIVMITSAIGQFFDPAQESVLPEVASEEELAAANSLMAISSFGATAVGFAASGLIASAANINWAFYINAGTYLVSMVCILLVRIKPLVVEGVTNVSLVVNNLKSGLKQLFNTPILNSMFWAMIPTLVAFGLSNALLLPFATRALGASEFEYGLQEGLTSIGFVVGSLLMAGAFDRMREGAWLATGFIGMALMSIVYSFNHSIPFAIIIVMISGFFNAPSAIGRRLIIQRNTPREMRGRVNSVFFVSRDILFLIGMGAAGLADFIDVRWMYFGSALLLLGGGILILLLPGLRQNLAEWKHALSLLKTAPVSGGLGMGRFALPADFDALAGMLPSLNTLTAKERQEFISHAQVVEAAAGTTIIKHGESSDAAYFILSGKAVAGIASADGNYRSLSTMKSGDFFGEISALTGSKRTADVVAEQDTNLIQVPAESLRKLTSNPALNALLLSTMSERLGRTTIQELPRFAGVDQQDARDLRTATE